MIIAGAMDMVSVLLGCGTIGDTGDMGIIVLIDGILGTTGAGAAMDGPVMATVMVGVDIITLGTHMVMVVITAVIMVGTGTHTMATTKEVMVTTGVEEAITTTIPWPITMLEMPYVAARTLLPVTTIRPGIVTVPI